MTDYPSYNPTSLIAGDFDLAVRRIVVVAGQNAAGAVLPRGTVLGKVTATGKYKKSVASANDGSQVPTGVLTDDIDASVADVTCREYATGEFTFEVANVDGSWTIDTLNAAFEAKGQPIFFRSVGAAA